MHKSTSDVYYTDEEVDNATVIVWTEYIAKLEWKAIQSEMYVKQLTIEIELLSSS